MAVGLGPVSKEMDEREGESRGLEGEQGDSERKTIPPLHSKGPNPDKGLRLSPRVRWSCVERQAAEAHCLLLAETPCLPQGLLPAPGGRLVLAVGWQGRAAAHLGFTSSWASWGSSFPDAELGAKSWEPEHKPELLLPVDPGHLSHIPCSLQEKRSQLG